MRRAFQTLTAIVVAACAAVQVVETAQADEQPSAKVIFENRDSFFEAPKVDSQVEPDGPPEQTPEPVANGPIRIRTNPTGLRYRIRLLEESDSFLVPNARVFRSGDQIQLLLTSNVDAYLAILQIADDSSMDLLYPDPALGLVENRVRAHQEVVFPGPQHGFRFVDEPGTERLLVVLAQNRHQLDQLNLGTRLASSRGSKLLDEAAKLAGDKRLQIVEVARSEAATYAVNIGGGYVLQEIRLTHR